MMRVEFKVKSKAIGGGYDTWEETPVYATLTFDIGSLGNNCSEMGQIANDLARTIAEKEQEEVRWNWTWSYQGHYIAPKGYVNLQVTKIVEEV